jgi:hypothetical protein
MTTYGHANLFLEDRWALLGAIKALNGMLLFGLTTAFLFAIIQHVWLQAHPRLHPPPDEPGSAVRRSAAPPR